MNTDGDTHVALMVSLPSFVSREVKALVRTAQIVPTIFEQLGLNPESLEAVVEEMTPTLPGLGPLVKDHAYAANVRQGAQSSRP